MDNMTEMDQKIDDQTAYFNNFDVKYKVCH